MEGPAVLGALKIVRASLELNHRLIPNGLFCSLMVMKKCGLTRPPRHPPNSPRASCCLWLFSVSCISLGLPSCLCPPDPSCSWFFQRSSVLSHKRRVRPGLPEDQLLLSVLLPSESSSYTVKYICKPVKVVSAGFAL